MTVVWGEEGGGSSKPTVERHSQVMVRATVAPAPYGQVAREAYGPSSVTTPGVLVSINASGGGVPKLPRHRAAVTAGGVEGDRQRDLRYHGGPDRAVCLYSFDLMRAFRTRDTRSRSGSWVKT